MKIVALGSLIAILGYLCVLQTGTYIALLGFAFIGLGFSVIIPELFRIGGNIKGVDSAQGVAFIAGTGYSGFLMAPPVLGYVGEQFSLKTTFAILLAGGVVVLLSTFLLRKREKNKG